MNGGLKSLLLLVALVSWGASDGSQQDLEHSAVPKLITDLKNPSPGVRRKAALSLAELGPGAAAAIPVLTRSLADPISDVRSACAYTLGRIGHVVSSDPNAVEALMARLKDSREAIQVRQAASDALGQVGPTGPSLALLKEASLRDPDGQVRRTAAAALGALDRPTETIGTLLRCLEDPDEKVCQSAQKTLAGMGEEAVAPLAEVLAHHPQESVRKSAVVILRNIGAPAVPPLLAALTDREESVRQQAVSALIALGPAAIPLLTSALADSNPTVRTSSAQALAGIGPIVKENGEAVAALTKGLEDSQGSVRAACAEALGRVGATSAQQALLKALSDPDAEVRQAAAKALEETD